MTTIKEVARYASVSVATVSRVINKTEYVSPDLVQRVQDAMETLEYRPNSLARSLRRNETMTVGILIPQLDHPFFSALAFAIERELFNHDYRAFICSAEENLEKEAAYVEIFLQRHVDGVIYVPTGQSRRTLEKLVQQNMPVVLADSDLGYEQIDCVRSRNHEGAYDAMCYLVAQGHRNIGVIGSPTNSEPMVHRMNGVRQAVGEFGLNIHPERLIPASGKDFEKGFIHATQILSQDDRPTAIFALNDLIAVGVMHAAARMGLSLPADLSVMGFDNIPLSEYSIPELTTVAQPIYEIGETVTRRLLMRLEKQETPPQLIELDTKLIIRQSVVPPQETR